MYDQGSEFIDNEFQKSLFQEEYGILANPNSLGGPNSYSILEIIHLVLGNLVRTYDL